MLKIGRCAGTLLVEIEDKFYIIGETKEPFDFTSMGLSNPQALGESPIRLLEQIDTTNPWETASCHYIIHQTDQPFQEYLDRLSEIFIIRRNSMISERIWELVARIEEPIPEDFWPAGWLFDSPEMVWDIVRDTMLRC